MQRLPIEAQHIDQAKALIQRFNAGVLAGDMADMERSEKEYNALVQHLNGGTHIGVNADEHAPACVLMRACAAAPGSVPLWGQSGEFLVQAQGISALVTIDAYPGGTFQSAGFNFHAIDPYLPFISDTGFRSCFVTQRMKISVQEATTKIILDALEEKKRRVMVAPEYRSKVKMPAWLQAIPSVGVVHDQRGQFALF